MASISKCEFFPVTRPGQIVLAVEISGYVHAGPCEFRGSDFRMITAFPSRKLNKIYRK